MMDAVMEWPEEIDPEVISEIRRLSLGNTAGGSDPENNTAVSEVFPPLNFVKAIERRQPELLTQFRCLDERHAIVRQDESSIFKLIQLDHRPHELFDLPLDLLESNNLLAEKAVLGEQLNTLLNLKVEEGARRRDRIEQEEINLDSDSHLIQRLRGLGYLD
jgi:hypothetical protein